jgi:hypothetical protein
MGAGFSIFNAVQELAKPLRCNNLQNGDRIAARGTQGAL